jgi:uncharacterized BrkB/YihY/UPF0761 family membrane protein
LNVVAGAASAIALFVGLLFIVHPDVSHWLWRGLLGLLAALAIPLLVNGFSWFVDHVGDRERLEGDAWRERPRF